MLFRENAKKPSKFLYILRKAKIPRKTAQNSLEVFGSFNFAVVREICKLPGSLGLRARVFRGLQTCAKKFRGEIGEKIF